MSTLDEIEARRAARKAALKEQEEAQRVTDLEALDALEVEHGDSNVCSVDVPFTPGLPTMAIARVPKDAEMKRYREGIKVVQGEGLDMGAINSAAAQLGRTTRLYPDDATFAAMCKARPDLASQLGSRATKLAQGKEAAAGKG